MAVPKIGRAVLLDEPPAKPLEQVVGKPLEQTASTGVHDIEACAKVLVEKLPAAVREQCYELAYLHRRVPLWVIVMGHVLAMYQGGRLFSPSFDPSWGMASYQGPMVASTCEYCADPFVPRRWGQRYCSNQCGIDGALALGEPTVAPETAGEVKLGHTGVWAATQRDL